MKCTARTLTQVTSDPEGLAAPGNPAPALAVGPQRDSEPAGRCLLVFLFLRAGTLQGSGVKMAWMHSLHPSHQYSLGKVA